MARMSAYNPAAPRPEFAAYDDAADSESAARRRVLTEMDGLNLELVRAAQHLAMRAVAHETAVYVAAAAATVPGEAPPPITERPASPALVMSYSRMARAVCDRIAQAEEAAGQSGNAPSHKMSPAARRRLNAMKDEVRHHVECSIRSHAEPRHVDRLLLDLDDRLDDPDVEAEFGTLTVGQMVLSVCRDLEVKVDLTSWPEETLNTARTAATNGRWQPPAPPAPSNGMARGMAADPSIEKLPTGVIGSPGVPPAIDLPPWSPANPSRSNPSQPQPQPPPQLPPQPQPPPPGQAPTNPNGHDQRQAVRRPPGSFLAR
jgi:hypothetical protein